MDKMKMESSNLADEKFEQLKSLFPNVVTETIVEGVLHRAIDKDKLMQEINAYVLEGLDERYNFTWPDKRKSVVLANEPTRKTLRPCRQESVNFDETENLYIEGDNLEVLKLLRHTYMGKIKMIYIDPPYNTGNDFLYKDKFYIDKEEYDENSGQYDENGNLLFSNTESNGRYHTDWLNMMYPRLRMARDLLTEDGAIFISIDDNEVSNLKKICDEIFGERNFIAKFIVNSAPAGTQSSDLIAQQHSYCICYGKNKSLLMFQTIKLSEEELLNKYSESDSKGFYYLERIWKRGQGGRKEDVPSLHFPVYYNKDNHQILLEDELEGIDSSLLEIIIPYQTKGVLGRWTWSKEKMKKCRDELCVQKTNNEWRLYKKMYKHNDNGKRILSIIDSNIGRTELGSLEVKNLMQYKVFDYPKPIAMIKHIINIATINDSIILDFFSGSSTTAHAVMELNAEDGGNRKFIMVQLPEETDKKSEAYKAGYKNICEIGKERIRRAWAKIKEENPESNIDTGFKVFKLDSSNMEDVYYKAEELTQIDISKTINNLKEDRTEEDLLYSIMLEIGVLLTSKIVKDKYNDSEIYFVDGNYIIACFDRNIKEDTITYIAEQQPVNIVLNQHVSDSLLTNIEQIFKKISAYTIIRMI